MEEKWKPVKGYEGLYEVSDYGNVRSLNYRRTGKIQKLKPTKDTCGYLQVCLCKNGKVKYKHIHRLVAEAFIPNPLNLSEANHKSECKMLNFACVLEWCNRRYNMNYGTVKDRLGKPRKAIDQFDKDGNFIHHWKSLREASRLLEINVRSICSCLKGGRKYAGGFVWKYAP